LNKFNCLFSFEVFFALEKGGRTMFQDYKVVITGATSGIGLATARLFIKEGATVIGIGRNFARRRI